MANSVFSTKFIRLLQEEFAEIVTSMQKNGLKIFGDGVNYSEKELFFNLSTLRNRNLINETEQHILSESIGAFFGMSVGSHAVTTWVLESKANEVRIADPDSISVSNLNRIRYGWKSVGEKKVAVVEAALREIQPFISVLSTVSTEVVDVEKLLTKPTEVHFIVDEIDDLLGKTALREYARKLRVPLISAADVGDMIQIDVERHDLDENYPFFHGRIPEHTAAEIAELSEFEKKLLVIQLVGTEHNSERMMESLLAIGKTIPTWPQLAATASISGGVVTAVVRKILLGEAIKSGRYYISLDEILVADYLTEKRIQYRDTLASTIARLFSRR